MSNENVDESDRAAVEKLCDQLGLPRAAEKLGMGKDSLLRIIARMPVRRGTLLMLKQALLKAEVL